MKRHLVIIFITLTVICFSVVSQIFYGFNYPKKEAVTLLEADKNRLLKNELKSDEYQQSMQQINAIYNERYSLDYKMRSEFANISDKIYQSVITITFLFEESSEKESSGLQNVEIELAMDFIEYLNPASEASREFVDFFNDNSVVSLKSDQLLQNYIRANTKGNQLFVTISHHNESVKDEIVSQYITFLDIVRSKVAQHRRWYSVKVEYDKKEAESATDTESLRQEAILAQRNNDALIYDLETKMNNIIDNYNESILFRQTNVSKYGALIQGVIMGLILALFLLTIMHKGTSC